MAQPCKNRLEGHTRKRSGAGRTFHREQEVFSFNLQPEADHRRPGMVNLQQYYLEQYLVERAQQLPGIELRWKNKVTAVAPADGGAVLQVGHIERFNPAIETLTCAALPPARRNGA